MIPTENQLSTLNVEAISLDHGVTGVFGDRTGADTAYDLLIKEGYTPENINILMAENASYSIENRRSPSNAIRTEAMIGAAIGLVIGSIGGGLATMGGTFLLPGLGYVNAALPACIAGGLTFAVGGMTIAAVLGLDNTEERLDKNILQLKNGEVLLSFRPKSIKDGNTIFSAWGKIPNIFHLAYHA